MASKKISELSGITNPSLTGITVIVDGGITYKTTLNNLKNTIVDGTQHSFTGSQYVSGTMSASFFVGDGSQLTNLPIPNFTHFATTGSNSFTGSQNITGSLSNGSSSFSIGVYSHAEGTDTYAYGAFSHTEGSATFTSTLFSNIIDVDLSNNVITVYSGSNFKTGHNIAYVYNASGNGNKVWRGVVAGVNGNFITASGAPLQPVNISAFWGLHQDGSTLFNLSSGSVQSGLGLNPVTGSLFAHAEGSYTLASGLNSHAEGRKNAAIGNHSHAEGNNSLAQGVASHAEGIGSISSGYGSHAEGFYTISSGSNSHSEGSNTEARGDYSHSEGLFTITNAPYQHVQGKYNIVSSDEGAFIIGNGLNNVDRSNLVHAFGTNFNLTGSLNNTGSIINDGFVILSNVSSSLNFNNDAEAAVAGVPKGGLYRSGSFILIRLT